MQFVEVKVKQSGRDIHPENMEQIKNKLNNDMYGTYQLVFEYYKSFLNPHYLFVLDF